MIFVITHKPFDSNIISNLRDDYKILHVGTNSNCLSEYIRDDTGDNISNKNISYCELTGLYWIWKNYLVNENDLIGISHYRRYFCTSSEIHNYAYFGIIPKPINKKYYSKALSKADIIVPKPLFSLRHNVKELYGLFHDVNDLNIVRTVLEVFFPDYLAAFDEEMNSHKVLYANMFICRKDLFDSYCEWLFAVLEKLEEQIDITRFDEDLDEGFYQKRIFGFIAERLLQVWIYKNELKTSYLRVFNTEERAETFFHDLFYNRLIPLIDEKIFKKPVDESIHKRISGLRK